MATKYITTPVPVDPSERHLPLSELNIQLSKGIATIVVPLQGPKTIENAMALFRLWKPCIVSPELEYEI